MKLLNKCVICYFHYLKSILNDDSFKEYINAVILINLKYSQFNSENIEILYLLSALKKAVQINCKKACSVMEQA